MRRTAWRILLAVVLGLGAAASLSRARSGREGAGEVQVLPLLDNGTGYPILADYALNGYHLKPYIDTGDRSWLFIPPAVYTGLAPRAARGGTLRTVTGATHEIEAGELTVPLLGAQRTAAFFASPLGDDAGDGSDSIFPLEIIGSSYAAFLLSRHELWLFDSVPGQGMLDDLAVRRIPYLERATGIFVHVEYQGRRYLAQLDTGGPGSIVAAGFARQHPELFAPTGDSSEMTDAGGATYEAPVYKAGSGLAITGAAPRDSIDLPGEFIALPALNSTGPAVAGSESQDEASTGDAAPVLSLGMDVLGRYDFMLNLRQRTLYLWSPEETDKLFPSHVAR